jgi:REP element-mobilizing transposase RayT
VEFPGAVYHVMARGNERKAIFRDDPDRCRFLETLGEMVERFGVRLHAYVLMPNHYHLLLETPLANLSQAVGWLQVTYTVRFNRRHRRCGHLFQGRFKAQLVEADGYAQGLVEYVHLNPVRPRRKGKRIPAERAVELDAYRWSSHRAYAGLEKKPPGWLCLDWLRYWGIKEPRQVYRRSMRRWFGREVESPWEQLVGGLVLGNERLLAKVNAGLRQKATREETTWVDRRQLSPLRERLGKVLGTEADERIRIWARVRLGGERGVDVARGAGYRDGSAVGKVVRRLEQRSERDSVLRAKLTRIKNSVASVQS